MTPYEEEPANWRGQESITGIRTERLIGGRDGASNRIGAARTLRAQKQLIRPATPASQTRHQKFAWTSDEASNTRLKAENQTCENRDGQQKPKPGSRTAPVPPFFPPIPKQLGRPPMRTKKQREPLTTGRSQQCLRATRRKRTGSASKRSFCISRTFDLCSGLKGRKKILRRSVGEVCGPIFAGTTDAVINETTLEKMSVSNRFKGEPIWLLQNHTFEQMPHICLKTWPS